MPERRFSLPGVEYGDGLTDLRIGRRTLGLADRRLGAWREA
jgi:hypothetical protein